MRHRRHEEVVAAAACGGGGGSGGPRGGEASSFSPPSSPVARGSRGGKRHVRVGGGGGGKKDLCDELLEDLNAGVGGGGVGGGGRGGESGSSDGSSSSSISGGGGDDESSPSKGHGALHDSHDRRSRLRPALCSCSSRPPSRRGYAHRGGVVRKVRSVLRFVVRLLFRNAGNVLLTGIALLLVMDARDLSRLHGSGGGGGNDDYFGLEWEALSNFVPLDLQGGEGLGRVRGGRGGGGGGEATGGRRTSYSLGPSPRTLLGDNHDNGDADGDEDEEEEMWKWKPTPPRPRTGCPPSSIRFVIKVFAYQRVASLDRLMQSLLRADYVEDDGNVALEFHVDGGASLPVIEYVNWFRWTHGPPPVVNVRKERAGLMDNIVQSWDPAEEEECEYAIFLEDDIEVSTQFYYYAKTLVTAGVSPDGRGGYPSDDDLTGVSFYTPKWNEVVYPNVEFQIPPGTQSLYLMQLPCSWGAVYFPWHWRQFRQFFAERRKFELAVEKVEDGGDGNGGATEGGMLEGLDVPPLPEESRTNSWQRSWKRYYIEYMFYRGLTMMYPNFYRQRSLSTTHRERGEHSGKDGVGQAVVDKLSKPSKYDKDHYIQPLIMFRREMESTLDFSNPPPLSAMTLVNLYHRESTRSDMKLYATKTSLGGRMQGDDADERDEFHSYSLEEYVERVHGAGFCALDGATPPETHRNWGERSQNRTEAGKKYLLYDPQNGLTNQIMQLQVGVLVSHLLGRTLVVPPVIAETDDDNDADDASLFLDPSDVFDLTTLPVDWVHYKQWKGVDNVRRVVDRRQEKRYLDGSQEHFFKSLGLHASASSSSNGDGSGVTKNNNVTRIPYSSIWDGETLLDHEVRALFGNCPDETLAFSNVFLLMGLWKQDRAFLGLPDWSARVKDAARRRAESFDDGTGGDGGGGAEATGAGTTGTTTTKYSCLHLRRGDFADYCGHIRRKRRSRNPGPYAQAYFRGFRYGNCYMDPSAVADVLRPRLEDGEVLYVATNEPNRTIIEQGFKGMRWRVSSDFAADEEGIVDPRLMPALDQAFCERSRVLYRNHWSSFSQHMQKRREARLYDGYHGEEVQEKDALPSFEVGFGELKLS